MQMKWIQSELWALRYRADTGCGTDGRTDGRTDEIRCAGGGGGGRVVVVVVVVVVGGGGGGECGCGGVIIMLNPVFNLQNTTVPSDTLICGHILFEVEISIKFQ